MVVYRSTQQKVEYHGQYKPYSYAQGQFIPVFFNKQIQKPFDYLQTEEEINEYLTDAFLDEDPEVFIVALGYPARKRGMSKVAKAAGVKSLYRSLGEGGNQATRR